MHCSAPGSVQDGSNDVAIDGNNNLNQEDSGLGDELEEEEEPSSEMPHLLDFSIPSASEPETALEIEPEMTNIQDGVLSDLDDKCCSCCCLGVQTRKRKYDSANIDCTPTHTTYKRSRLIGGFNSRMKFKEECRKMLRVSIGKLRKIEDPEGFLRRSVLVNNVVKRIYSDMQEEKQKRMQAAKQYMQPSAASIQRLIEAPVIRCEEIVDFEIPVAQPGDKNLTLYDMDKTEIHLKKNDFYPDWDQGMVPDEEERTGKNKMAELDYDCFSTENERVEMAGESLKKAAPIERKPFALSCGQSSILGDLQTVVYHSLMTSLETS